MRPGDRIVLDGCTLTEMSVAKTRNDAIAHTLRHFLDVGEEWDLVGVHDSFLVKRELAAAETLERLGRFASLPPWPGDEPPFDARWWSTTDLFKVVLEGHDLGYYPRCAYLFEKAGKPGAPGGYWRHLGGNRWWVEAEGYEIWGDYRGNAFYLASAYLSYRYERVRPGGPICTADDLRRAGVSGGAPTASSEHGEAEVPGAKS